MRRTAVAIAFGIAVGCFVWHLAGATARVDVPLAGPEDALEDLGGAGGRVSEMEPPPPLSSMRLAASGARRRSRSNVSDDSGWQDLDTPGFREGWLQQEGLRRKAVIRRVVEARRPTCWRYPTPWEPGAGGGLVTIPFLEHVASGVTERAYAILGALIRLDGDLPALGAVDLDGTPSLDAGWDRDGLVRHLHARTGQSAWNAAGVWIGEDPPSFWAPDGPLRIHQTAEVHRQIERVLDEILGLGGDARTVRVWRGELGPGTLRRGELRRLEGLARSLPSSPAVEGPLELDVPVGRAVTAFSGRAHTLLFDYGPTGHVGSVVAGPIFALAHAGLSVRGRIDSRTGEIELEITEAVATPPFPRRETTLGTGGDGRGELATIEMPERSSRGAVVRLTGTKGDAWLVGLGAGRAAVVELGDSVPGAGSWRPAWGRTRTSGFTEVAEDAPSWEELSRAELGPPPGDVYVGLVRPSRTEGAPPSESRVRVETGELSASVAFSGFDLTWEEALPHAGMVDDEDRQAALRGGTCVRARWVGGSSDREAYDVVLSVAEPLAMREGPPVLTYGERPTLSPCRLPSFRRALVPLRIVVPHGDVGRRTVMLDLGQGSEPWTVSLTRGRRQE